jgi:hypothetical protein
MQDQQPNTDPQADTVSRKELYLWLFQIFMALMVVSLPRDHQGLDRPDIMLRLYFMGMLFWCMYKVIVPPAR